MRDGLKEYCIMKQACIDAGCFIPEEHEFHSTVANTPAFIREYFHKKGVQDALYVEDEA